MIRGRSLADHDERQDDEDQRVEDEADEPRGGRLDGGRGQVFRFERIGFRRIDRRLTVVRRLGRCRVAAEAAEYDGRAAAAHRVRV